MPESTSVRKLKVRPANPVGKGSVWTGRIEATSKVVGILGALVAVQLTPQGALSAGVAAVPFVLPNV